MRLLIDTNIILEMLLEQAEVVSARQLLSGSDKYDLIITDFAIHSIGLLLFQRDMHSIFREFVEDMLLSLNLVMVNLTLEELGSIDLLSRQFKLDFDDAYQYAVAEKYDLDIVSFDRDFDRTDRGRKTPAEILQSM